MWNAKKGVYGLLRLLGHQEWIRYGIRNRILCSFCNPDTVASYDFEVEFFGFKYRGNLNSYLDWVVYYYGAYEKPEMFLLRDLVIHEENPIFVDVGANVGQHSLFMSKYCKEVHSFEPYDAVRAKLQEKLILNDISNITIHNVGLSDKNEELDFFAPTGANTGTGSFLSKKDAENNKLIGKLKVVNGDDYLYNEGIKSISLIKIDVEGFEKAVLSGLKETLRKYRPIIFMEFSEHTQSSFAGVAELEAHLPDGYRIQRVMSIRPFAVLFCKNKYELIDFDFNVSGGNLIFMP